MPGNRTPPLTMIDTNDLINPINLNKIDINEINFFSGIPDLYFDDQNPDRPPYGTVWKLVKN